MHNLGIGVLGFVCFLAACFIVDGPLDDHRLGREVRDLITVASLGTVIFIAAQNAITLVGSLFR
jgi:hypothetical protein